MLFAVSKNCWPDKAGMIVTFQKPTCPLRCWSLGTAAPGPLARGCGETRGLQWAGCVSQSLLNPRRTERTLHPSLVFGSPLTPRPPHLAVRLELKRVPPPPDGVSSIQSPRGSRRPRPHSALVVTVFSVSPAVTPSAPRAEPGWYLVGSSGISLLCWAGASLVGGTPQDWPSVPCKLPILVCE